MRLWRGRDPRRAVSLGTAPRPTLLADECHWSYPALPSRSSLSGVGLAGSIPVGGWSLPDTLTAIDLGNNAIKGSLPKQWDLPASVQRIYLDGNPLIGRCFWVCGSGGLRGLAPTLSASLCALQACMAHLPSPRPPRPQSLMHNHAPLCRHAALLAGPCKPAGV